MNIYSNYEAMFGHETFKSYNHSAPTFQPINMNEKLIASVMNNAKEEKKFVLLFVIGTKPCFYKFYGSILAANKKGVPNLVVNSNQHYEEILTYGIKEFQLPVSINLSIKGDLIQKSSELILKLGWLGRYLKEKWPTVTVIPVVLGDTILTSITPIAWMFSRNEKVIHNEAGLRSMTPDVLKNIPEDMERFVHEQFYGRWHLLRNEPFPEQWNTFVSSAGAEYMFAPIKLNKDHLIREGYPKDNIFVVGGAIVDALELKLREKAAKSIFGIYPKLESGEWIRVDIHRRENLTERRFKAIIGAVEELVKKGYNINFIELNATRYALDSYNLRHKLQRLEKHENFLFTPVWLEYANVIEFFNSRHFFAALTDSGGVQEELNMLNKVCMTCRLNTDRPETVNIARNNLLVPPISPEFIVKMVDFVSGNDALLKEMRTSRKLYGEKSGEKMIDMVSRHVDKPFKWAHEALNLWKEPKTETLL